MSLIHEIPREHVVSGDTAWSYGVLDVYYLYACWLNQRGFCSHKAGAIAHRVTHGGLFSTLDRQTPERWIA